MKNFKIIETEIPDLVIIDPFCVEDNRGYYIKTYEKDIFKEIGLDIGIYELCGSFSKKGVLRGLHVQTQYSQSKLVRCAYGKLFDVAVDVRPHSKTFGQWFGTILDHIDNKMIYIPAGFAHGVMALSEEAVLSYHSAEKYVKEFDSGIIWNDKDLNIAWPLEEIAQEPILSNKDQKLPTFQEFCDKYLGKK